MTINKKLKIIFKIIIFVLLIFFGVLSFTAYQIWHYNNIKLINGNETYYSDPFGNIYIDTTTGCLDICLTTTYTKLPVDKKYFTVLMVKSPFTFKKGQIGSTFGKDNKVVYYMGRPIKSADALTFIAIGYDLAKDKNQYFIYDEPLQKFIKEKIDPKIILSPNELKVISYNTNEYIIISHKQIYYYVKLNPQPMGIKEISSDEAKKFPKI
jgi:hypothetical protein